MISCNQKGSVTFRMHQVRFFAVAPPRTPLAELMTFPQSPESAGEKNTFSPFSSPSTPAAPHLEFGGIAPRT